MCAGTELWYLALYANYFIPEQTVMVGGVSVPLCSTLIMLTTPIFAFKQVTNVLQLSVAMKALAAIDADTRRKAKE